LIFVLCARSDDNFGWIQSILSEMGGHKFVSGKVLQIHRRKAGGKAEEVPAEKDMSLKKAATYVKDPLLGDIWRSYAIFIDTPTAALFGAHKTTQKQGRACS
jgi:hypothetical protein